MGCWADPSGYKTGEPALLRVHARFVEMCSGAIEDVLGSHDLMRPWGAPST